MYAHVRHHLAAKTVCGEAEESADEDVMEKLPESPPSPRTPTPPPPPPPTLPPAVGLLPTPIAASFWRRGDEALPPPPPPPPLPPTVGRNCRICGVGDRVAEEAESAMRLPVTEEEEVEEEEGEEEEFVVEERRPTPRSAGGGDDVAPGAPAAAMGLPVTPSTKGSRSAMVKVALLRRRVVGVLEAAAKASVEAAAAAAVDEDEVLEVAAASLAGDE